MYSINCTRLFFLITILSVWCIKASSELAKERTAEALLEKIEALYCKGVNATDKKGRTCLYLAAQHNQVDIIHRLLENPKIDVNKTNIYGTTPLAIAVTNNNIQAVKALLNCDKNCYTFKKKGELNCLLKICIIICECFKDSRNETIKSRLKVDLPDKRLGYTPLMIARLNENQEIIKLLLAAGANPNMTNNRESIELSGLLNEDTNDKKE